MIKIKIYNDKNSNLLYTEEEFETVIHDLTEDEEDDVPFNMWIDEHYTASQIFMFHNDDDRAQLRKEYDEYINNRVVERIEHEYETIWISTDFYYNENEQRIYFEETNNA